MESEGENGILGNPKIELHENNITKFKITHFYQPNIYYVSVKLSKVVVQRK